MENKNMLQKLFGFNSHSMQDNELRFLQVLLHF